jgi:hypothetical protein
MTFPAPEIMSWATLKTDDATPTTVAFSATGNNFCQLGADGSIWYWSLDEFGEATWVQLDNNSATIAVITDGDEIYQLHNDGSIWAYVDSPEWELLDSNSATIAITAADGQLFQLHRDGSIWLYEPDSTPSWLQLDNKLAVAILCTVGHLYQLLNDGSILEYNGTPFTGWLTLDANPATVSIAADGEALFQLHNDGSVWGYDHSGTPWQEFGGPNDFLTTAIATGPGGFLAQLQRNGDVYAYVGSFDHPDNNSWTQLGSQLTGGGETFPGALAFAGGQPQRAPFFVSDPVDPVVFGDSTDYSGLYLLTIDSQIREAGFPSAD